MKRTIIKNNQFVIMKNFAHIFDYNEPRISKRLNL
jgi:hypothetical protein